MSPKRIHMIVITTVSSVKFPHLDSNLVPFWITDFSDTQDGLKMMSDAGLVDGSWELTITVTDLQVEKSLRVKGDVHIGGVMLQLVEALGM